MFGERSQIKEAMLYNFITYTSRNDSTSVVMKITPVLPWDVEEKDWERQ
jgi:hypothetical protein